MNAPKEPDRDLQQRERELQERERAIRLREIEAEIERQEPPLYQTKKHQQLEGSLAVWYKRLAQVGKFMALVIAGVVAFQLAQGITAVIVVGGLGFIAYKLFFESERKER
ncbi:hypothetical protein [Kamptonema formosum]|uniref:hypothetical protein n=1 Tax=Kamptonema formosum TaxID=331992 RepID=UPI00034BBDAF|nr:hypothetical protein [Oscillatoria sp. PCC 10802]